MTSSVDRYTELETALHQAGLEISVSEVHGTLVGALANHLKSSQSPDLLALLAPKADSEIPGMAQLSETLYAIYRDISEALLAGKEGFELCLPDEDSSLDVRADGLAQWARGYVLGLFYNNAFSIDQLPENGAEISRDFMQIAEAAAANEDSIDEDWALAELEEYVKVGAQLIFEFIYSERAEKAPATPQ